MRPPQDEVSQIKMPLMEQYSTWQRKIGVAGRQRPNRVDTIGQHVGRNRFIAPLAAHHLLDVADERPRLAIATEKNPGPAVGP